MAEESFKRKLTAILSADVEGYSRLMGDDEDATIRTLTTYRELMSTLIEKHRGRVVDSPGDNLLAEFGSVVDAVRCAVEIQEELRVRNAELPEERKMVFRIGINLGDVVEEGERIYGDGINIAARVEGLAEGGGICISGSVYDSIKNKLSLSYESMGEHTVKNIREPVRVFRMRVGPEAAARKEAGPKRWRWAAWAAVVAIVVVFGALVVWNFYFRYSPPPVEAADPEKMAYPLPDKPSIAVLPFTNMSGDPEQEYLSDGISENIITGLSCLPDMLVISRNSTFSYKGKSPKIKQVSEELGVRYVLEGSLQKEGDKIRITAQLIDATTGHHLWAKRYDRKLKDLFDLQDEITIKVLEAMQVKLTQGTNIRTWAGGAKSLDVYLKFLEGTHIYWNFSREGHDMARQIFEEVITMEPEYIPPYNYLAFIHLWSTQVGWSDPKESIKKAFQLVEKALLMDASHPGVHRTLSYYYTRLGQFDKSLAAAKKAIELDPNNSNSHLWLGFALKNLGRPQEAIPVFKMGLRINPLWPFWNILNLGGAYNDIGSFEEAIPYLKKAIQADPKRPGPHRMLAVSYGALGRDEEAHAQIEEHKKKSLLVGINPSLERYQNRLLKTQMDPGVIERKIELLRKAGLPD